MAFNPESSMERNQNEEAYSREAYEETEAGLKRDQQSLKMAEELSEGPEGVPHDLRERLEERIEASRARIDQLKEQAYEEAIKLEEEHQRLYQEYLSALRGENEDPYSQIGIDERERRKRAREQEALRRLSRFQREKLGIE